MKDGKSEMKKIGNPNTKPIIFVSIICLISIVACIWSNYRLIKLSKERENEKVEEKVKPKNEEKKKEEEKPVVEEEKDITDEAKLNMLKSKQSVLKNYTSDQIISIKSRIYERDLTSKDLIEERKLISVLYSLYNDKKYEELDKTKYPNINQESDGPIYIISLDSVKELYSGLYGGNIDTSITFPSGVKEHFAFNSEYNVYVVSTGFGGTCMDHSQTYDYAFKEDSNNLYVYSSFAYESNCPREVYKDLEKTEKYSTTADESFTLDESNYEQFHHFKITYTKKGDNYIFDKIEKIK